MKDETGKTTIHEVIVVEGKDDIRAVKAAVNATVLAVGGFSVKDREVLQQIRYATEHNGAIVLTDPDPAGEFIRRVIREAVPEVKHAYITVASGTREKDGNIGVENASPDTIRAALEAVQTVVEKQREEFSMDDLLYYDLMGCPEAADRRKVLGEMLSMGHGNGKQFLRKLNSYGITREALEEAVQQLNDEEV